MKNCRVLFLILFAAMSVQVSGQSPKRPLTRQPLAQSKPLSFSQVEDLIGNATPDSLIAREIRARGIAFRADCYGISVLKELGAGEKTIKSIEDAMAMHGPEANDFPVFRKKVVILVAEFKNVSQKDYAFTEILLTRLRESTKEYIDIDVRPLGRPITAQQGSSEAVAIGRQNKADIVLWGWYSKTDESLLIDVHCEFLQSPGNLVLLNDKQTLILPGSEVESFALQLRLASEMTYLTFLTVGLARLQVQDYNDAILRFTKAIESSPPKTLINPADIYVYRGMARFLRAATTEGDLGDSLNDFSEAIKINPDDWRPYVFRGIGLMILQQADQALADWDNAIKIESDNPLAYIMRGALYREKNLPAKSDSDLAQATRLLDGMSIDDGGALYFKALINYIKQDYKSALAVIDALIERFPEIAQFIVPFKVSIDQELGNYDVAIQDLTKALACNHSSSLYALRADIYDDKKQYAASIKDLDQAIKLDEQNPNLYISRARAYNSSDNPKRALEDYSRAIKLKPDLTAAYSGRALLYEQQGDYKSAREDFDRVVALQPDDPESYHDRARFLRNRTLYAEAIADASEALKREPQSVPHLLFRGFTYQLKGDTDAALKDFNKAAELNPRNATVYYFRADLYKSTGNIDQAITEANFAIEYDPADVDFYMLRGGLFEMKQDLERAIGDYKEAVKLRPDSVLAKAQRDLATFKIAKKGLDAESKGDSSEAFRLYDRAISINPQHGFSYYLRGSAYLRKDEIDRAIADFSEAIRLEPTNAIFYNSRAGLYAAKNDMTKAEADFNVAMKLQPASPDAYLLRGKLYAVRNNKAKAIADLQKVLQLSTDPGVRQQAEEILKRIGSTGTQRTIRR